jgi:hypothetical protein
LGDIMTNQAPNVTPEGVQLKRFDIERIIALCDQIHATRVKQIVADCRAAGITATPDLVLAVVESHNERGSISALIRYACSIAGSVQIVREAANNAGVNADALLESIDGNQRATLAMAIVGHPTSAAGATA